MGSILLAIFAKLIDCKLSFHVNLVTLGSVILTFTILANQCHNFSRSFFGHIIDILSVIRS